MGQRRAARTVRWPRAAAGRWTNEGQDQRAGDRGDRGGWLARGWLVGLLLLLGSLGGVLGWAGPAGAATGGPGPISFSFGPYALPGTAPRPDFSFSLEPGTAVGDALFLQNRSSFPQTFKLYATDVYNQPRGGAFAYRAPGGPQDGPASWIDLVVRGSVVGPGGSVVVPPDTAWRIPFTVTAPSGTAPGTYAAGIVALDVTTIGSPTSKNFLQLHEGIGARVFMTVLGHLTHAVAVGRVWVTPKGGGLWPLGASRRAEVHVQVANTGNSVIDEVTLRTSLDPAVGGREELRTLHLATLLPGATVVLSVPATLRPIEGPTTVSAQITTNSGLRASGGGSTWSVPWGLGLLVLVLLAALVLLRRRRRHGRRRARPAPSRERQHHAPVAP
ncbi:hypothetical protein [Aciditerrimonas ferrireducens]|uniref:hypothetical protein n=1 Tax=Aciditerrimonas ferrireducens TaxID=667306 RepID=UPI0020045DBB|nr:hypothetical protein [Aciditerrimonas ferrireducens]MCK4176411.1 hypothetical protein [Aciditerrimonas ferrireducens]